MFRVIREEYMGTILPYLELPNLDPKSRNQEMAEIEDVINTGVACSRKSLKKAITYTEGALEMREKEIVSQPARRSKRLIAPYSLKFALLVGACSYDIFPPDKSLMSVGVGVVLALIPATINTINHILDDKNYRWLQRRRAEIMQAREGLEERLTDFNHMYTNFIEDKL